MSTYPKDITDGIDELRSIIKRELPDITEQLDLSAKMIAYCYGQRYTDMICVIVPSQKGIKLSFYKGVDLPDPENILQGNAKTTRYLQFKSVEDFNEKQIVFFLENALKMYEKRK